MLSAVAVMDLRRARDHYAAIDRSVSLAFADAFGAAVDRIGTFPNGAPPVDGIPGLRRARMKRFPYGVFYRPDVECATVVRVLHSAQDADRLLS